MVVPLAAKGVILVGGIAIAAGVALYEHEPFRIWVEQQLEHGRTAWLDLTDRVVVQKRRRRLEVPWAAGGAFPLDHDRDSGESWQYRTESAVASSHQPTHGAKRRKHVWRSSEDTAGADAQLGHAQPLVEQAGSPSHAESDLYFSAKELELDEDESPIVSGILTPVTPTPHEEPANPFEVGMEQIDRHFKESSLLDGAQSYAGSRTLDFNGLAGSTQVTQVERQAEGPRNERQLNATATTTTQHSIAHETDLEQLPSTLGRSYDMHHIQNGTRSHISANDEDEVDAMADALTVTSNESYDDLASIASTWSAISSTDTLEER